MYSAHTLLLCISACCMPLDSAGKVVGSKAIIVTKRNGKTVVSKSERHVLQYGDPQSLTAETVATIGRRWQPNTLSFVLERESTHYAWYNSNHLSSVASCQGPSRSVTFARSYHLRHRLVARFCRLVPGEVPGVNHGGLAYRFTQSSGIPARVFPVVSSVQPR